MKHTVPEIMKKGFHRSEVLNKTNEDFGEKSPLVTDGYNLAKIRQQKLPATELQNHLIPIVLLLLVLHNDTDILSCAFGGNLLFVC